VPLIGHTYGHAGIAVRTESGWLLQAGDAYFHRHEMDAAQPWCTPGLRAYQWLMEKDRRSRLLNQQRLRELGAAQTEITICCSHDPVEFERLAGRPMSRQPEPVARTAASVDATGDEEAGIARLSEHLRGARHNGAGAPHH
jgi:glyoxylase-like metal-dependent hydrolase (beta-lactamase superfamily II)